MRKFISCGLIAAFALLPTAIQVCAEPPPAEPVGVSIEQLPPADCTTAPCQEQQASK